MKIWCIAISIHMSLAAFAYSAEKKVLVIESYHPSLAWTEQCERGIRQILAENARLAYFYMDTKRIPEAQYPLQADSAWDAYLQQKPDLVMIGDDNGLRLLGPRFGNTRTPVVFFGINNNPRSYFNSLPSNITGLLERVPIVPWLRYLKEILPKSDSALILMDKSQTSLSIIEMNFKQKRFLDIAGIKISFTIAEDWNAWKQIVTQENDTHFLLFPTFHAIKDDSGHHISVEDVVTWTSKNSPVPVFTNQDYTVHDQGVVGAYVIQGETHGRQAAQIALDILSQKTPSIPNPPRTDRDGIFYFNLKQMARFQIHLPEDIRLVSIYQ